MDFHRFWVRCEVLYLEPMEREEVSGAGNLIMTALMKSEAIQDVSVDTSNKNGKGILFGLSGSVKAISHTDAIHRAQETYLKVLEDYFLWIRGKSYWKAVKSERLSS